MWLVDLALRRPYTFVVMAMLTVLLACNTIRTMGTDILPEIDIPVISVVWLYAGISPEEMEQRITGNYERALTTTVNDIEHIESLSIYGNSVVKVFFHPGAKIEAATAQVTAISQTMLRQMPPGMQPPLIIRYSASNVPILQASLGSDSLSEQKLFDLDNTVLRSGLAVVQGAQLPFPYGGKQRLVMVDLDPQKLYAFGISASDVSDAMTAQSLILPSGVAKFGDREYSVRLNSSPTRIEEFNNLPIRMVNGAMVCVRDVAHVRDGYQPQTNMVHVDGKKGALQPILKSSGASTLDIVARVKTALPPIRATLPEELNISLLFDQSLFVRAAVDGVIKEGVLAAALTGLMILLFLGSWRSTLIVVVSIPLSILTSIIALAWLGQTLNLMTLGGMALAVGILVDDATVTIENIHRNLGLPGAGGVRKGLTAAIIDGAQQIAVPAFVSTLCICIVFVPVVFITGAAKSLFVPLAMAVVFAMLTSYFLSRTLVPTLIQYLLRGEAARHGEVDVAPGLFARVHAGFERGFLAFQRAYVRVLDGALDRRVLTAMAFGLFVGLSLCLVPLVGRDFFPNVDGGQFRLHVRCPPGTRIEESERWFARIEDAIRGDIRAVDLSHISDTIGIPNSSINLSLGDPSQVSPADGEILVSLKEGHAPTPGYVRKVRAHLAAAFPEVTCFFLAADISSQVLNFGLSAPIDIQLVGPLRNRERNFAIAERIRSQLAAVPGAVDVHLAQVRGAPEVRLAVDRVLAQQAGFSQKDVASNLLITLASSQQTAPNFWLDAVGGVQYLIAVQAPQAQLASLAELGNVPIANAHGTQLLSNLTEASRGTAPVNITHYNAMPTTDVLANVDGTDLGTVSAAVDRILAGIPKDDIPRGTSFIVRGQVESMNSSFTGLAWGLLLAIVLVYLVMVVNFQSWLDPLIILGAVPGALAGIIWALFLTQTTFSVPALMGAIMAIGVATANSILVVSFANDQRRMGLDAAAAARLAGSVRLRPVLMTAAAMIIGMVPMSLGLSEGGEQNAPLARAVIGGLVMATLSTLLFVPVVYSALRRRQPATESADLHPKGQPA